MRATHPALAAKMQYEIFDNNEFETPPCSKAELDAAVRYYPGSKAGPLPEDDPEHYSEWFWRNQAPLKELVYGKDNPNPSYKDIGVKWRFVYHKSQVDDEADVSERQDFVTDFVGREEPYPQADYDGAPEFDIADREKYDTRAPGKLPAVRFHSHIHEDEMLPLPPSTTLDYDKLHWELEKWSVFTGLPTALKREQETKKLLHGMNAGLIPIPNWAEEINPPSLWAYYSTLPRFAR